MGYSASDASAYGELGIDGTTYAVSLLPAAALLGDLGGKAALDFGAGTGRTARLLHDRGASRVVAVDKNENMLRAAHRQCGVSYVRVDGPLPLRDKSVGAALCANVFSEFGDLNAIEATCREIGRVVGAGAPLVIVVPNPDSYACEYVNYRYFGPAPSVSGGSVTCLIKGTKPVLVRDHFWSVDDYAAVIGRAGFDIADVLLPVACRTDRGWLDEVNVAPDVVISCIRRRWDGRRGASAKRRSKRRPPGPVPS